MNLSSPAIAAALRHQSLVDLSTRAYGGAFVTLPLWLLLGWGTELVKDLPAFFWANAALLFVATMIRLRYQPRVAERAAQQPRAWWIFVTLLLWPAIYWGAMGAMSVLWPPLQRAQTPILFMVTAMTAAGGLTLSINSIVRFAYPLASMVPPILAIFATSEYMTGMAFLMFLFYIVMASRAPHDDYWSALRARAESEGRARKLEHLYVTDTLTQLRNRLFFDQQLSAEWASPVGNLRSLSLLMIDVDHFKKINDEHGHPFGDVCLKAVATALQDALWRPGDTVARYGGEEFAVLLPGIDAAGAEVVAQRLLAAVAAIRLAHDGSAVRLTCSIGLHSVANAVASTPEQFISSADQALYSAKSSGRNRVAICSPLAIV